MSEEKKSEVGNSEIVKRFIIHNPEKFLNELNLINCGKKLFAELNSNDFAIPFSETKPIEGYPEYMERLSGEKLPNCCEYHKGILSSSTQWFERFPDCCSFHKRLKTAKWFNKNSYSDVPNKIVSQLSFTEYHIRMQIEKPEWYKDITDYIEYNVNSFGQFPDGYGNPVGVNYYISNLKEWIKNGVLKFNFPKDKRLQLVKYIESYEAPLTKKAETSSLNILHGTYQKWLKIFPFELSFFSHLEEYFTKQLPILNGQPDYNKYTQTHSVKTHTRSSLINALVNLTSELLTQINSAALYEKWNITDANRVKIELIVNSRKLKLKQGYNSNSQNEEERYRKILKEWYKDEKKFIDELKPLLSPEDDFDFVRGQIQLQFFPQGAENGYFFVIKGNSKRRFSIERLLDLELRNWEFTIDSAPTKKDKLQAANNAVFRFRKDYLSYQNSRVQSEKEKKIIHLYHIIEYIEATYDEIQLPPQTETETQKLKAELSKYGFFELPKIKMLSGVNQNKLIELIRSKGLPYCIAMFDFLEFLTFLQREHFSTKYKLYIGISKWFNSDSSGRAVKGNINTLSKISREDKRKYTAHLHKETVKTDYQELK